MVMRLAVKDFVEDDHGKLSPSVYQGHSRFCIWLCFLLSVLWDLKVARYGIEYFPSRHVLRDFVRQLLHVCNRAIPNVTSDL